MLLTAPAARAARLVARDLLGELAAARVRLDASDGAARRGAPEDEDTEALHDFRVALRRLRSTVRAYDAQLGDAVGKKGRRWLRRMARATGEARDLEVHVAWLAARRDSASRAERAGIAWLLAELEARRPDAARRVRKAVDRDADRLHDRLATRLATYEAPLDDDPAERWGAVVAAHVQAQLAELREQLGRVRDVADQEVAAAAAQEPAHEARIAGKRVRYLLEPVKKSIDAAAPAIDALKELQDALGDMHDAHVFGAEVATAVAECEAAEAADLRRRVDAAAAGDEPPAPRVRRAPSRLAGLRALQRALAVRERRSFAELHDRWLHDGALPLVAHVEAAIAELRAAAAPDRQEVERKYLLRRLPRAARRAPSVAIEQGYLPGAELQERVRRTRGPDGDRYVRTVKLGAGVARTEVEEATTRDVFRTLWRLTKGRRVRKRRHLVPHDGLVWEVDRFLDRDLVLAELELPAADTPVVFPDWLAEHVVREVTDEGEFTNARLAK